MLVPLESGLFEQGRHSSPCECGRHRSTALRCNGVALHEPRTALCGELDGGTEQCGCDAALAVGGRDVEARHRPDVLARQRGECARALEVRKGLARAGADPADRFLALPGETAVSVT